MHSRIMLVVLSAVFFCSQAVADDANDSAIVKNSIGMPFVRITIEPEHDSDAFVIAGLKRRLAPGRVYYLGMYEVTQSDFIKLLGRNPSVFAASGKLKDRTVGVATERLPVDSVSWNDAVSFCRKLSKLPQEQRAGRRYRLPSSDEWEYAARGGTASLWDFGDDRHKLGEYAWFGFDRCGRRTHVVGGKKANALGLYDMYGNVWEWSQDADTRDAVGGSPASQSPSRIIRGGGWMSEPGRCNSVYWQSDPPAIGDPDTGFRVLMEAGHSRRK